MMVNTTNGFTPSPSRKSASCIINQEPRSPPTKRISDDLNSAASTPKQSHADSDSHHLQLPTSTTRSLKRLFKSASKNALKLASTLSSRRHHSSFDSSSPKSSSTEESGGEAREGMVKELRAVFRHLDADGDGKISWVQLKSALNSVEEEAGENELREMIKELDSDGDGCIDMEGLIRLNSDEKGAEEAEKELMAAFRMFEGRQLGGGITPMGLQRMMSRVGVGDADGALSVESCTFIVSQLDLDGDGVVNFDEFKRMMTAPVHRPPLRYLIFKPQIECQDRPILYIQ